MNIRLLALFTPLLLLVSCAKDGGENGPVSGDGTIRFEIGFTELETRVSTDIDFICDWDNGDEIGIFAVRHASGGSASLAASDNYIHNAKLSYDGVSWSLDNSVELSWPTGGDVLDFYAYYPFSDEATDPTAIAFNTQTDQSGAGHKASYLLSASASNRTGGQAVSLNFRHQMALVQVQATGDISLDEVSAKLYYMKTGGSLDLGAGGGPAFTTGSAATNISMCRMEQEGDTDYTNTFTFRALVPAQTLSAGTRIFGITIGDKLYNDGIIAADRVIESGNAYWLDRELPREGGIWTAEDLVLFSEQWNAAGATSGELARKAAQDAVIAAWSDDGTATGVVRLRNHIDMSDVDDFEPIGYPTDGNSINLSSCAFNGKFNGRGFKVKNLTVNVIGDYAGLFGSLNGADIRNIVMADCNITASDSYAGSIAGYNNKSTITNCTIIGVEVTANNYAGGIAGYSDNSSIADCTISGSSTVTATNSYAGGIAGENSNGSTIKGCTISGNSTVTATNDYAGGIAGWNYNSSTITGCTISANSTIAGRHDVGGIAGCNDYNSAITGCMVSGGAITGAGDRVGGIVGYKNNSMVAGCIAAPTALSGNVSFLGLVVGYNYGTAVSACYWATGVITGDGAGATVTRGGTFDRDNRAAFFGSENTSGTPLYLMNEALQSGGYPVRWKADDSTNNDWPINYIP